LRNALGQYNKTQINPLLKLLSDMLSIRKTIYILAGCVAASLFFTACGGNGSNNGGDNTNISAVVPDPNTEPVANTTTLLPGQVQLAVRPPFPGVDIPKQTYKASGTKATVIEIPSGTKIEIPANCFVDKNGKAINEDVEINYREFHNAADILTSGIPIQDTDGRYMETAGMFEIGGKLRGEEVFVAPNKEINVKMASFNEGDRFDFFKMEPKTCKWDEIDGEGKIKAIPNSEKVAKLKEIDAKIAQNARPIKPKAADKNKFAFDLDVNYEAFPELKNFKGIIWEYAGNKDADNPEKQTWVMKTDWDDVELKSDNGSYKLILSNKKQTFETTVRPILSEKDQDKALAEFDKKMKTYEDDKMYLEMSKKDISAQNNVFRAIAIEGFGIFNWDCLHNPERIQCETSFVMGGLDVDKIQSLTIFLVSKEQRAVIQFAGQKGTIPMFSFNPDDKNMLVALLPNNEIATVSANVFKKLNAKELMKSKKLNLAFERQPNKIKNVADVQKLLDQLS